MQLSLDNSDFCGWPFRAGASGGAIARSARGAGRALVGIPAEKSDVFEAGGTWFQGVEMLRTNDVSQANNTRTQGFAFAINKSQLVVTARG